MRHHLSITSWSGRGTRLYSWTCSCGERGEFAYMSADAATFAGNRHRVKEAAK